MITKEFVKEYNAKEFLFKHPSLANAYNCVVLSTIELGTSIKPFFVDDAENQKFLQDFAIAADVDIEEAENKVNDPRFCLAYAHPRMSHRIIAEVINTGRVDTLALDQVEQSDSIVCPHA